MKVAYLAAAAALGMASAAWAASEAFDNWVAALTQNGWRLVAVSEPLKAALLMGADTKDAQGRRITTVRYEFMGEGGQGGWKTLVVNDAVDCKEGTISRVKVTGYPGNNLGGQAVEQAADAQPLTASPNSFLQEEVHYACGLAVTLKIATASADPKKALADPNRLICRTETPIGSTIPVRHCMTKQQEDERRRTDQENFEKAQREIPVITSH